MSSRLLALLVASCLTGCNGATVPTAAGSTSFTAAAGANAPAAAAPAAAAPAAAATAVIASANGLSFTRDDAEAFLDAFQFSLEQVGRPKTFTAAEREELIKGLAQNFAKQPAAAQQELVKARATWTATKAAWATTAQAEQRAFVKGVLGIAVGEPAAAQLTGEAGAGGGGEATGGDPWAAEAKDKCENGSFEDQMFYCHGVQTPTVSPW